MRDSHKDLILSPVKRWPTREYEPLESETGLFRGFADLKSEPEQMARFAGSYGALCAPSDASNVLEEGSESLSFWVSQIEAMRTAIKTWELVQAEQADPDELSRVAEVIEQGRHRWVQFRFVYDPRQRLFDNMPVITSLIGAIWQQFADAVSNNRQYRRCPAPGCGRWYELSPATKGPNRNHCSVACKQRAYRHRKDTAKELFNSGRSIEQIAEEIGASIEIIKRWVGKESSSSNIPDVQDTPFTGSNRVIDI